MRAITIALPEDLDDQAAAEARRLGISKSELIRRGLAAILPDGRVEAADDPWSAVVGFGPVGVSVEPGEIDEIVYEN